MSRNNWSSAHLPKLLDFVYPDDDLMITKITINPSWMFNKSKSGSDYFCWVGHVIKPSGGRSDSHLQTYSELAIWVDWASGFVEQVSAWLHIHKYFVFWFPGRRVIILLLHRLTDTWIIHEDINNSLYYLNRSFTSAAATFMRNQKHKLRSVL